MTTDTAPRPKLTLKHPVKVKVPGRAPTPLRNPQRKGMHFNRLVELHGEQEAAAMWDTYQAVTKAASALPPIPRLPPNTPKRLRVLAALAAVHGETEAQRMWDIHKLVSDAAGTLPPRPHKAATVAAQLRKKRRKKKPV